MVVVRWRSGKIHVSADGVKTACGALIPVQATRTIPTVDWVKHTTCYNCAYRLWPEHGPADYLCPSNGKDFPIRKKCQHGRDRRSCVSCTPSAARNWPCPKGCTDPADHDPLYRYPKCVVRPPIQSCGQDGRCIGACESTERVMHRANPGMWFDLADSASMCCYHCGEPVCVACQRVPVDDLLTLCAGCDEEAAGYSDRF